MHRATRLIPAAFAAIALLPAQDPAQDVVFRSDVALVRVDVQVAERSGRAIGGLRAEDFVLREEGQPQQIRNFGTEKMPVDVLVLIDVSGSMRPHVQRLASAASQAVQVLGDNDRTAVMVFDRSTRVRMPFRTGRQSLVQEFDRLLDQEGFNGGTDITRALLDAAKYVRLNARREARRAIVILTDDETERERNEAAVNRELAEADAVLCALIAPNAMRYGRHGGSHPGQGGQYPGQGGQYPGQGGQYPGTGGQYPGSGGGIGGSLGGIILGRRGTYGGNGPQGGNGPYGGGGPGGGGVTIGGGTHSAGTSEIARHSGGDSLSIDQGSAFEDTLSRIRNRYALHFYLPPAARAGQVRNIEVDLTAAARRRYPDAELRYRRTYVAPQGAGSGSPAPAGEEPVVVSQSASPASRPAETGSSAGSDPEAPHLRRRPAVDPVPISDGPATSTPSAPRAEASDSSTAPNRGSWRKEGDAAPAEDATPPSGGSWRRLKPGEQP